MFVKSYNKCIRIHKLFFAEVKLCMTHNYVAPAVRFTRFHYIKSCYKRKAQYLVLWGERECWCCRQSCGWWWWWWWCRFFSPLARCGCGYTSLTTSSLPSRTPSRSNVSLRLSGACACVCECFCADWWRFSHACR